MRRPLLTRRGKVWCCDFLAELGPLYILYSPVDHCQGPREGGFSFILCPCAVSEPWSDGSAWRKVFVPSETLLEEGRFPIMGELPKGCRLMRVGHGAVAALRGSEENDGIRTYRDTYSSIVFVDEHDMIRSSYRSGTIRTRLRAAS